ncbi:MAG: hypothetical protein GX259_01550 [Bacteroidales bacterium]|nr:hypothetical protein [Bacteroidales bacterium]
MKNIMLVLFLFINSFVCYAQSKYNLNGDYRILNKNDNSNFVLTILNPSQFEFYENDNIEITPNITDPIKIIDNNDALLFHFDDIVCKLSPTISGDYCINEDVMFLFDNKCNLFGKIYIVDTLNLFIIDFKYNLNGNYFNRLNSSTNNKLSWEIIKSKDGKKYEMIIFENELINNRHDPLSLPLNIYK